MADEQERGARRTAFRHQQTEKTITSIAVERRCRFVRDDEFRAPQQRACDRDPLLLPDGEFSDEPGRRSCRGDPQFVEQAPRFSRGIRFRPSTAHSRETRWQQHIVHDRQVGQQVEHLEYEPDVGRAEFVATPARQQTQVLA